MRDQDGSLEKVLYSPPRELVWVLSKLHITRELAGGDASVNSGAGLRVRARTAHKTAGQTPVMRFGRSLTAGSPGDGRVAR